MRCRYPFPVVDFSAWRFKLQIGFLLLGITAAMAAPSDDARTVAALDTRYQKAVKENDAATMSQILHDQFVLVVGNGTTHDKQELLREAQSRTTVYERQDEEEGTQMVRMFGDTAIVTAKLWLKGNNANGAFERKLWFSDTYVRTPTGWRYAFGQASLALPAS